MMLQDSLAGSAENACSGCKRACEGSSSHAVNSFAKAADISHCRGSAQYPAPRMFQGSSERHAPKLRLLQRHDALPATAAYSRTEAFHSFNTDATSVRILVTLGSRARPSSAAL